MVNASVDDDEACISQITNGLCVWTTRCCNVLLHAATAFLLAPDQSSISALGSGLLRGVGTMSHPRKP